MKIIVLLSILFFSVVTNGVKNDYIAIEWVGDADKPMPVIIISKKPIPYSDRIVTIEYDDLPENYIVSNDEFAVIKKYIKSTQKKLFEEKDYHHSGFKITISEKDSKVSYFIYSKNSNSLLLNCMAYLKGSKTNKDLISRLDVLKSHNVLYGKFQ